MKIDENGLDIRLTEDNIIQWKLVLDDSMKKEFDLDHYSSVYTDEQWLEERIGDSVIDVIYDEISAWD